MEFDLLYMKNGSCQIPNAAKDTAADLKMDLLYTAMAGGNQSVYQACQWVMSRPLNDHHAIAMRKDALLDAAAHRDVVEELLKISESAITQTQKFEEFIKPKYDKIISNSNKIVAEGERASIFIEHLKKLRKLIDKKRLMFRSDGWLKLCNGVDKAYSKAALDSVQKQTESLLCLKKGTGVSVSGHIGEGLKQEEVLINRFLHDEKRRRFSPVSNGAAIPLSSVTLINNAQEIVEKALSPVLKTVTGFNRSAGRFFEKLSRQLRFFAGCILLKDKLESIGVPVCYPEFSKEADRWEAVGMMDTGLALKEQKVPVGNDIYLTSRNPVIITGPNQGGKTTFLRSVGLNQLMAQCGMFVAAENYVCPVFQGIYTHFPNGEDSSMRRGLLEVELNKLSSLVDVMKPGSLLFMNESFQTTMAGDGIKLAQSIVPALCEAGVKVLFVTHLYGYAKNAYDESRNTSLFLLAQRSSGDRNTYRMAEGPPFKTAYGMALFRQVMKEDTQTHR